MINLKHKTAFNYHETNGGVTLALKIGLDYARLHDAKTKDVFVKRLNGYGCHRKNPIEISDVPLPSSTPLATIQHFSGEFKATVRDDIK